MKTFEAYRVFNWYYYLGFVLIGLSLRLMLDIDTIKHVLLGASLLAYAFSFNNYYDKHEKRKFFILPLILSFCLLPLFNFFQIIVSLIFLIIVTLYSAYPFRLKAKPFISSFCNGFGFTIIFLLGYFIIPNIELDGIIFFILLFSFNMIAQFIHEVVDLNEDKKDSNITTAVFLGKENIKKLCYLFLFSTILLVSYFFYLGIINILIFISTISFEIFFMIEIKKEKIDINLRKKFRIFGILIGVIYIIALNI